MPYLLIFIVLFLSLSRITNAIYDPLSVPNNAFGIHVVDPNDIPDTATLINSSNGDWGYVTIVIPETDRNTDKWQQIFNQMRRLHLIPLVRLATHTEGSSWTVPKAESIEDWVSFLNSLNWPVENRYVILFNEPNHANEWGGSIDPEGYARIATELAKKLKDASEDFFILPAGLDASAASDGSSMDEYEYVRRMVVEKPEILTILDGWTSHSYPNPGFSGSPYANGRGTLRSFVWELDLLSRLGIQKNLPVFITETGWIHAEGKTMNPSFLTIDSVTQNIQIAVNSVWRDTRVVAVTPFVFSYQDYPFDHFSWKKLGINEFYSFYNAYQAVPKTTGQPRRRERYELKNKLFPSKLVAGSSYSLATTIMNKGQGIFTPNDSYSMRVDDASRTFSFYIDSPAVLEPGDVGTLNVHVTTPPNPGTYTLSLVITHGEQIIPLESGEIQVVAPPSLRIQTQLGWRSQNASSDVVVLVYKGDTLIHKFTGLSIVNGTLDVAGLRNIIPGQQYRIVVRVPYYLPRQIILPLTAGSTSLTLKRFLPLDYNNDGAFTLADSLAILDMRPHAVIYLFFGNGR